MTWLMWRKMPGRAFLDGMNLPGNWTENGSIPLR